MKKRSGIAPLIAIGGILLALSVGSFFLTPDRAFSENENRYLQLTPKLSWDNILSGKFMKDTENYTSDQIILRDVKLCSHLANMYHLGFLCNFNITFHNVSSIPPPERLCMFYMNPVTDIPLRTAQTARATLKPAAALCLPQDLRYPLPPVDP